MNMKTMPRLGKATAVAIAVISLFLGAGAGAQTLPPVCTLPGVTMYSEPPGPVGTLDDLLSLQVAEPCSTDGMERLVLTLKVDGGFPAGPPPDTLWFVDFQYGGIEYEVGMDTTGGHLLPSRWPEFFYARHDGSAFLPADLHDVLGRLDDGSGFSPDGTIQLVLPLNRLTVGPPPSPPISPPRPGAALLDVKAVTELCLGPPGGPCRNLSLSMDSLPLHASDRSSYRRPPAGACGCAAPDPCALPGVKVWSDPTGDAATQQAVDDIQYIAVSEPLSLGGSSLRDQLVFTLKMQGPAVAGVLPPLTAWPVFFSAGEPPGRYFVDMETDTNGVASFNYGTVADTLTSTDVRTIVGAADSGSGMDPGGTIRLVIARNKVGNPAPGTSISKMHSRILSLVDATAPVGPLPQVDRDAAPDTPEIFNNSPATYTVRGNAFCDPAPVAALSASPSTGLAPLAVNFSGAASSDTGGDSIASYTFDFGDGTPAVNQAGATTSHTYTAPGTYTASLNVTDASYGKSSATPATQVITVNAPNLGQDFYTLTPCRVLDTRQQGGALVSGVARSLSIAGACGVPATAKAVSFNLTAVTPTAAGSVAFYPDSGAPPIQGSTGTAGTIDFTSGQTRANNQVLALAAIADGTLQVQSNIPGGGSVHVIVDVNGYFQ